MSEWLGSWDSLATGVYRPGTETTEEYARECMNEAMFPSESGDLPRSRIARYIGYTASILFLVFIIVMLLFSHEIFSIFY